MSNPETTIPPVMTACVTPFKKGESDHIDMEALQESIDRQVQAGHGILLFGTTGEGPTITEQERGTVIREIYDQVRDAVPVAVGVTSSDTRRSIEMARQAFQQGTTALLCAVPPYNKPPQEGLRAHFEAVANSTPLPFLMYNVPGRSADNLEPVTMQRIADSCGTVAGVKEASDDANQIQGTINAFRDRPGFVWAGNDDRIVQFSERGVHRVVSVASNVAPEQMQIMAQALAGENLTRIRHHFRRVLPLAKALFPQGWPNPIAAKETMAMQGRISNDVRLPLVPMTDEARERLRHQMTVPGVLSK
jgi:4-hydroxy-tetrahydrodipicolinate synthase